MLCRRFSRPLKIVSLIDAPSVIERILRHLKLWDRSERPPSRCRARESPQIVVMPFRYEVYSTTVDELFDALGRILEEIVKNAREESTVLPSLLEEGPPPNPEDYLITILSNLQAFARVLRERIGAVGRIKFSDLIAGMPMIEAARTFILLLFAATNGTVVIDQEGEDDLLVILVG